MGVKQKSEKAPLPPLPTIRQTLYGCDVTGATRIQQPHDYGKKAWKRAKCYRAERSIVCTVFIFIEAITGPLNSIVVRDDFS